MSEGGTGRLRIINDTEALEILSNKTGRVYYYGVTAQHKYGSLDADEFFRSNVYELASEQGLEYILEELKIAEGIFAIMYKEEE